MKFRPRPYQGQHITVIYDIRRCIHAEECVHGLPVVFDREKRPWIQPDEAAPDQLAEVILRCPTGALKFERPDGGAKEPTPSENQVIPSTDGPYYFKGDLEVSAGEGEAVHQDTRIALCRCGASHNKPICDGTHAKLGFQAPDPIPSETVLEQIPVDGKLKITAAPNGPYLLRGSFEVRNSQGEVVFRGSQAALCRCGGSGSKPFCDGTHKREGFSAEGL